MRLRSLVVAMVLALLVLESRAQAAPITYDFVGDLVIPFSGQTAVTGQFTYDEAIDSITSYLFSTPAGPINVTTFPGAVRGTVTGTSIGTVSGLIFSGGLGDFLALWFTTSTGSFDPVNHFVTTLFTLPGGGAASQLLCSGPASGGCESPFYASPFSSGSATLAASTAVPEPMSLLLLSSGLTALFCTARRREGA